MKQWVRRLLAAVGSLAVVAAMLGVASVPAAASSSTVSFGLTTTDLCGDSATASGTITEYVDGLYSSINYSASYSGNWAQGSVDVGSTAVSGFNTVSGWNNPVDSFTAGTNLSGGLSFPVDFEGCTGGTTGSGYSASTLSSPGSISLGSYSGMPYNQVQVTINSNLCNWSSANDACENANWTITQQQLNSAGTVMATNTYSLSTRPSGSATWTSGNQQLGYAYQYTASAVVGGTSYSTNTVLFPVAGTPTAGSITSTSAVISWPAGDNASPYTVGYWLANGGAWPGTTSSVSGTSTTISGLTPNTEYYAGIAASTPDGGPAWAQGSAPFWTLANPPTGVSLSFSGSTATVSWGANGNPSGTTYQYSVVPAGDGPVGGNQNLTTAAAGTVAGVCGGSYVAYAQAENGAGVWTGWVGPSSSVAAPACLSLSISAPSGYPPSNPNQINVTVASVMSSAGTATITQQQLSPAGSVVATNTFSVSVGADSSGTTTATNQQIGGAGYVYKYTATMSGQSSNAALFANAPTFYVHRRTRGLFVTWPDEGNGAQYDVFSCNSSTFNSGLLPVGTTQWAATGLTPNTQYPVCMWAQIAGQPITSGGWLPTWWVSGGNTNSSGMWYTLPDVPGEATPGGLLAAYYNVPSLQSNAGPSEQVFGNNAEYPTIQGPINFSIACNCTSSWPYVGYGGPMPTSAAGAGTAQDFAVKFLGWVYASSAGTYTFGCQADDACQVWVNGQPVVQGMTGSGPSPNYYGNCNACGVPTGTITLAAGNWYPIEIDYTQVGGGASLSFTWTPPGGSQGPVPAADLAYPALTGSPASAQWQATISWAANGNPAGTSYSVNQVFLGPSGAATQVNALCAGTTGNSCTTTNLSAGTVSDYYVTATSGDGYAAPASPEPAGGGYAWAVPPAQSGVQANSSSSLTVSWPTLGNGAHYEIEWAVAGASGPSSSSGDLGTGATSYTISGLSPNTQYQSWLTAWIPESSGVGDGSCGGGGCALYWNGNNWTLANPPASLVLNGSSNSISMNWSADGDPASTTYDWSITAEGGSNAAQSGSTPTTDATASGLVCQSNYTAGISAVNGAGVATVQVTASGETGTCSPPPKVALEIDNGLAQTATTSVTLDVQATDQNYGQSQLEMRFSNDGASWSVWQAYAPTASWTLTGSPGPNTVYAEVQDPQHGLGSAIATISYDSSLSTVTSGSGTACTYDGTSATCTKDPIITATFPVPSGAVSMETSFDGANWSQPQDAKASVSLVLPTGNGLKAVFARYFNQDNVATPEGPDYFVLDTTPPVIQSVSWLNGAAVTNSGSATLVVQASDNISPASALQVSVGGSAAWSGALPSGGQIPLTISGSGYVTVIVTVTDQAGNAATAQASIYN